MVPFLLLVSLAHAQLAPGPCDGMKEGDACVESGKAGICTACGTDCLACIVTDTAGDSPGDSTADPADSPADSDKPQAGCGCGATEGPRWWPIGPLLFWRRRS